MKAFLARHHIRAAFARRDRDGFDAGDALRLRHHGPRDAVAIVRELVLEHVLQTEALLGAIFVGDHLAAGLDVLAEVGIPFVAVLQNLPLEEPRGARRRVAVSLDRFIRPFASQPELSPSTDVLLGPTRFGGRPLESTHARCAFGSEDAVELLYREPCDRIVLVHEDDRAVGFALDVKSAGSDRDLGHRIAVGLEERQVFG